MTFVDPISLNLPSPSPSTSTSDAGPSRKRPRSEVSSEERKEARAHRNRIAAQNSRDKRKAQFSYLERRVAELEEENKRLKAGILVPPSQPVREENPSDKENEELRERIKTLEKGWDAVLKALASQGLPLQLTAHSSAQQQPVTPVLPASSPASSHSSLDSELPLDLSLFSASTPSSSEVKQEATTEADSTRHLAAGGFQQLFTFSHGSTYPTASSLNLLIPQHQEEGPHALTDPTMESLFHEILVDHPEAQAAATVEHLDKEGSDSTPHLSIKAEAETSFAFEEMNLEAYAMESSESTSSLLFGAPDPVLDIDVDLDFDNDELKRLLEEYCSVPPLPTPAATPITLPEGLTAF